MTRCAACVVRWVDNGLPWLSADHPVPTVGKFDLVLAEALDRISRDQADIATLFKHLRFAGVQIVTLAEGEISELQVGLKGTMNALFLKDLAAKAEEGLLDGLDRLEDEAVVERLTRVRGVGLWTAEMFLMFGLGRPDVWPVRDLGLRRAAARLFGVAPEALPAFGEAFRPYRSHLAWYLWRSLSSP